MTCFLHQIRVQSEGYHTTSTVQAGGLLIEVLFTFTCLSATFILGRVIMASPLWEPGSPFHCCCWFDVFLHPVWTSFFLPGMIQAVPM